MSQHTVLRSLQATLVSLVTLVGNAAAQTVGTAFTYQGDLTDGGSPVTGTCVFEFTLWDADAGGTQVGPTLTFDGVTPNPLPPPATLPAVNVVDGIFEVKLDFGEDIFNGQARWLNMAVCCPAPCGGLTPLNPRQELTPTPYSLRAGFGVGGPQGLHVLGDKVGIRTDAPASALQVGDGVNQAGLSIPNGGLCVDTDGSCGTPAGSIRIGTGGIKGTDSSNDHILMLPDGSGKVGIGTSDPQNKLHVVGHARVQGDLIVNENGNVTARIRAIEGDTGGELNLSRSDGTTTVVVDAEQGVGNGARLELRNGSGSETMRLAGQDGIMRLFDSGGAERITLQSTGRLTVVASDCCEANGTPGCNDGGCESAVCAVDPFCCDTSWDSLCAAEALQQCGLCSDPVRLPTDSVDADELLDEPGLASSESQTVLFPPFDIESVISATIDAPTSGYALVLATVNFELFVPSPCAGGIIAISDEPNPAAMPNPSFHLGLCPNASVVEDLPVTVHGVFSVTPGLHTFYTLVNSSSDLRIEDRRMTVVFLPTAYGSVAAGAASDFVDGSDGPAQEISSTSRRSMGTDPATEVDELEHDLAALRSQMESLERRLSKLAGGS